MTGIMFRIFSPLAFLLIILICCKQTQSEILKGRLDTTSDGKDWVFLARFCFLSDLGQFAFKISYPESYTDVKLLLYFDEDDQWSAVYRNDSKTCLERASPPHILPQRNQEIVLKPGLQYYWSGCSSATDVRDGTQLIECIASRTFKSSRERWWYIVASNCADDKGIYMDYEISMTNGHAGNRFIYHFSADEQGILETDMSFMFGMIVIGVVTIVSAAFLHKKKYLHSTFKMFMVSVFIKIGSLFLLTVAYGAYANDGNPKKQYIVACIGRIIGVIAYLVFILMIILLAKGYTVTRGKLSLKSEVVITIFMTVYSIAILMLYLVEFTLFDPAEVLYLYDFMFGIGLVIVPLIGFLWLIYAVFFTLKHYPEKWKFYIPFLIFFGFWFLTLPIIVIAANFLIPVYMREKVVNGVEIAMSFLGYLAFLVITSPNFA